MKIGIHGFYYLLPILTFCFWTTAIVGLLALWVRDNYRQYENGEATIVFISDVGAAHRTFFIIFCALTAVAYITTTFAERHLRHQRRIPGSIRKKQTILDICSVICAIIGSLALLFLSIFDAFDYSRVHWSMTVIFIVFVALSVLFQTLQVFSLSHDYDRLKTLKILATIKALILGVAIAVAIGFGATYATCSGDAYSGDQRCDRIVSAAAVCEWTVAFILDIFFLTYVVDLWPAHKRAQKGLSEDGTMVENKQLAREQGTATGHPNAPYAIDGERNIHDTYYPSEAAKQYHHQKTHDVHPAPPVTTNTETSPKVAASTLPGSERGSLYQTPMTEARPDQINMSEARPYHNHQSTYNTYQP
ncbi:uncharacterized protein MEPE_01771 [Melanopsichium pennsylvanicum]|uniref:CWH43-like N-terminal domain-containing protein n=2 Tax=Melanopsichium pennsylvanicum TaxID=63383 RepID=A0AAJ4XJ11_9BASI|nr:conserved hypothetical protein [Melanopsichium pennsylvanicum 4]SNX83065.1 uncharacterized protein MEPE_01771 [Melanopsichium pennsylvanicum]